MLCFDEIDSLAGCREGDFLHQDGCVGVAGEQQGVGEGGIPEADHSDMDIFNDELIEAVDGQEKHGKRPICALDCFGVDGHGRVPRLDQEPQALLGCNHELVVELLAVEVVLLVLVDDQEGEVVLLGVLDEDRAVLALTVAKLKRGQLEVVGQQLECHFLHPSASCNLVALVLQTHVEEDRSLQLGCVAVVSEVQVEVKRVLGEGTQAKRQRSLQHLLYPLAI